MHTKRSNVRSSFARDPEDGEMTVVVEFDEVALVDGSDSQLSLDGRNEGRSLEECSRERFESTSECLLSGQSSVKSNDADVLLSCNGTRE